MSTGPLRGFKSHIWEGGHRVPIIAHWPDRTKPGRVSDEPVCLIDMMATFDAIASISLAPKAGPERYDISPALLDKKRKNPIREALVHHSENGSFAIRQGKWKFILDNKTSGGWMPPEGKLLIHGTAGQLYDLEEDVSKEKDLWEKRSDVVKRLARLLEKYKKEGPSAPLR